MEVLENWKSYFKEKFSLKIYSFYTLGIVLGVFFFNKYLAISSGEIEGIFNLGLLKIFPMFIIGFLQIFLINIIDELKDFKEDGKSWISEKGFKIAGIICASLYAIISVLTKPISIIFIIIFLGFLALNYKFFFIQGFMQKHELIGTLIHNTIYFAVLMNLSSLIYIDLLHVWPILFMGYFLSLIFEVGNKIDVVDEFKYNDDSFKYTNVFGIKKTMLLLALFEIAVMLIQSLIFGGAAIFMTVAMVILINLFNLLFIINENKEFANISQKASNIYIFVSYISLALLVF